MDNGFADAVNQIKDGFKDLWWKAPTGFPPFDTVYDDARRNGMEAEMESSIDRIVSAVGKFPAGSRGECPEWGTDIRALLRRAGTGALGFAESEMDLLLGEGFCSSTSGFMDRARSFDSSIKLDDTFQAMRNVWVMNIIQLILDKKVEYTPALFAYSMLYPYTDNYLDSTGVAAEKKSHMGAWLRQRLEGKLPEPSDSYEERLSRLVGMIEGDWPRERYPYVYESLLGIHDAQQNSLSQQKSSISPYEGDILDLSFKKGGSSVLADAFLIKGSLTPEETRFMFGFGVVLQLLDDLQDAAVDGKNGHMTLFSQTAGKWPLDSVTNKLLSFTYTVLEGSGSLKAPAMKELAPIMKRSLTLLTFGSIAQNAGFYSKGYLKNIEAYSPLGFKYARSMFGRIGREYRKLKLKSAGRPLEVYMARALASSF